MNSLSESSANICAIHGLFMQATYETAERYYKKRRTRMFKDMWDIECALRISDIEAWEHYANGEKRQFFTEYNVRNMQRVAYAKAVLLGPSQHDKHGVYARRMLLNVSYYAKAISLNLGYEKESDGSTWAFVKHTWEIPYSSGDFVSQVSNVIWSMITWPERKRYPNEHDEDIIYDNTDQFKLI